MGFLKNKRKRKIFVCSTAILAVFAGVFIVCAIYVNDYYRADNEAIAAFVTANEIEKEILAGNDLFYAPEGATTGFIFYPGGKVEYTAYEPLMKACASEGILCVLVEMPFNLAVLDMKAADGIPEQFPEIENWYIGGHSLGGSMAASYLADHVDAYKGLVLLAAYSTADLSGADIEVLSVYGSEDQVLNRDKYEENKSKLPENFTEIVIGGGCHAYFGMYGAQDGDGIPAITNEEQIHQTVEAMIQFMGG